MSVVKHFIEDSIKRKEIEEFLQNEFERAGYGGVSLTKTPLGTHIVIYTMRPGLVIGRGGETIRALAQILEQQFQLPSPQISVAEIEVPELNAHVVASRIASALKRGIHYRRSAFWAITNAMEAGALGIEIIISGKLRTDRARYEKFIEGYLPKSGDPPRQYMRTAELHVHLKPGTLGVKVSLLPPDAVFPDKLEVYTIEDKPEPKPEAIIEEKVVETPVEQESTPAEEPVKAPESEPVDVSAEEKETAEPVTKDEKPAKAEVAEPEVVEEPKAVEPEAEPSKEPVTEESPEAEVEVPVKEEKSEEKVTETESVPVEEKNEAGE
ncbi:MAG: 30S ribosomal protein S3 [Candidatus Bathyarchaeota archaeon]|nr:MAG: 30S ribosomal protein S3 [Candidatus Bathyarchaeum tardum]WNZ28589.1 MAG: 30S ribosomal protein S3 [Candidatus Bathyarchaeota archaeon]